MKAVMVSETNESITIQYGQQFVCAHVYSERNKIKINKFKVAVKSRENIPYNDLLMLCRRYNIQIMAVGKKYDSSSSPVL